MVSNYRDHFFHPPQSETMKNPMLQLPGNLVLWFRCMLLTGYMLSSSILLAEEDGEEDENAGSLRIISETTENSAAILIREEEEGSVPEKDKEEDKKRKTIGIGEAITLNLNGKPQLIGKVSKLKWSITAGANLATFDGSTEGTRKVRLIAKKNFSRGGKVTAQVAMESGDTKKCSLSVVVPSGIKAKHRRKSYNRDNPNFHKRGVPSRTVDGEVAKAGASAWLELTFQPTTVSFKGIQIMERDKGTKPAPAPALATVHTPNPRPIKLNDKNRIFDNISSSRRVALLKLHALPQNWYWICDWNCHADGKDTFTVTTVNQNFNYSWINRAENKATTTVSKFGRSVTRTTEPNNTHDFK